MNSLVMTLNLKKFLMLGEGRVPDMKQREVRRLGLVKLAYIGIWGPLRLSSIMVGHL